MEEQAVVQLINQLHQLQSKLRELDESGRTRRPYRRMVQILEDSGYVIEDPLGQPYDSRRTDLEVTFGDQSSNSTITEVLKPVIYRKTNGVPALIQKGVVIV